MNRPVRALVSLALAVFVSTLAAGAEVRVKPDAPLVRVKPVASTARLKPDTTYETPPVRPKPDTTYHSDELVREVLLSRQLAEQAHVGVGDVVTFAADAQGHRATEFRVVGTYEPMADPRRFSIKRLEAHLHLPDMLALSQDPSDPLSLESVGALNIALIDHKSAKEVSSAIAARDPSLVVQSTVASSTNGRDPFAVLDRFHWAISIVTVAGSTAFLLALMVMRAEERREIIGILRLIGVPPRSILTEVLLEGFLIAIGGALFGVIVAVSAQGLVNRFFQWRYDTTLVFVRITPSIAWQSAAFAVPLGVVAGLAASWTLLRRHVISLIGR